MKRIINSAKSILVALCVVCAAALASCNYVEMNTSGSEDLLQEFRITYGSADYYAKINQYSGVISNPYITSTKYISSVKYTLAEGASITPDPAAVTDWGASQSFSVVRGTESKRYTVELPSLVEVTEFKSVGYLPVNDYAYDTMYSTIDWGSLSHLMISFLLIDAEGNAIESDNLKSRVASAVRDANNNGVKAMISIAKSGDYTMFNMIKDADLRANAINNIIEYIENNNLDGVDIDYEDYSTGELWNGWSGNYPNLELFMSELHAAMKAKNPDWIISTAVSPLLPYSTEWQNYSDFINLMIYDENGPTGSTPVQHAPMDKFEKEIERWLISYNTPSSKLIPGVPFYGYTWESGTGVAYRYRDVIERFGTQFADVDLCTAGSFSIYYNGRPTIREKCEYIRDNNVGGVMIWQILQDTKEYETRLINVIGDVLEIEGK